MSKENKVREGMNYSSYAKKFALGATIGATVALAYAKGPPDWMNKGYINFMSDVEGGMDYAYNKMYPPRFYEKERGERYTRLRDLPDRPNYSKSIDDVLL